mmetsp:Transcript_5358/g.11661  ORF Transcript_5358/g.11661 Transcript_5358/m.11661 type:complete len:97 (-) Transcript_5358:68-358(-)
MYPAGYFKVEFRCRIRRRGHKEQQHSQGRKQEGEACFMFPKDPRGKKNMPPTHLVQPVPAWFEVVSPKIPVPICWMGCVLQYGRLLPKIRQLTPER